MSGNDYCSFYVGQKVVCVDDSIPLNWNIDIHLLVKGTIYTILGIQLSRMGKPEIRLDKAGTNSDRRAWRKPNRFRPLTDISIFEKMLTEVPIKESV